MATLYYNAAVDTDWNNISNWWIDSLHTIPATNLPTSIDDVVLSGTCDNNTGDTPTVANIICESCVFYIAFIATNSATFNNGSSTDGGGTVLGDAIFNDYSENYSINVNGYAIFNNMSWNRGTLNGNTILNNSYTSSIINGAVTLNYISTNEGTINGNATFNDNSFNAGMIFGNATFNHSSFAYPTSAGASYGGTVTFQNRTSYPLKRGINGSSLLGVV